MSNVTQNEVPKVLASVAERLRCEVPRPMEAELWTAIFVLLGLRYEPSIAYSFLRGVGDENRLLDMLDRILDAGTWRERLGD